MATEKKYLRGNNQHTHYIHSLDGLQKDIYQYMHNWRKSLISTKACIDGIVQTVINQEEIS
jgi:hypothetical protein